LFNKDILKLAYDRDPRAKILLRHRCQGSQERAAINIPISPGLLIN